MKQQTPGTWAFIATNCVVAVLGVLQGVDWVSIVGSQTAGIVVAIIAAVNAAAHYVTGGTPTVVSSNRTARRAPKR